MINTKILIVLFSLFIFNSCDKNENGGSGDIYGKWEATEFISVESVSYPKNNSYRPVIEFKSDGNYGLRLDMNICVGSFSLKGESKIKISSAGCTKICCDSEFSKKFSAMLPRVTDYAIEENKLKLNVSGWGWIVLDALNNRDLMSLSVIA